MPAAIAGDEADVVVSIPDRHAIYRFPQKMLSPSTLTCGSKSIATTDQLTLSFLPPPATRQTLEAPSDKPTVAEWQATLAEDLRRARTTEEGLRELEPSLPPEAMPAADNLAGSLRAARSAIETRRKSPGTLDSEHYIASFRAMYLSDALVAGNELRGACGLARLDFDRHTTWGAARNPTVQ
ncbi:hypothetical protein [Paractinoplanes lichenicola]|uniref:Uncharacterized protein n=1 Tax=Paractinoplanes lichenicola TaxID=2802976 RepID=A0ABS1VT13_9ACTN|nr:hypothetical protein [Actinoplanes lichenicola]MBL7257612.1 hypothetical protein [Actinoplanes lichenicola]